MAKVVLIPKTKKDSVIFRIQEIAKNESERAFLLDHVCMRMQERGITQKQIMQILIRGKQIGEVVWDSEAKDIGFKCSLNAISAGESITVAAKLIERNNSEIVLVITAFKVS